MRKKQANPDDTKSALAAAQPAEPDQDDYQTKDHLDTLMKAEMIKGDPEKMEKVHKLAGRHSKALDGISALPKPDAPVKSVSDLKTTYQKKFGK